MPDNDTSFGEQFFGFVAGLIQRAFDGKAALEKVLNRLDKIDERLKLLMALSQESKDLLKKVDTATSAIGARIQALLDRPNVTEAEFRAELTPLATALEAMGKDPVNPVPPLPPPVVPPVTP